MKKVGMTWQVDPKYWEEYKDIHLNPWPELIEAIQAVGIHNFVKGKYSPDPDVDFSGGNRIDEFLKNVRRASELAAIINGQINRCGNKLHRRKISDGPAFAEHAGHADRTAGLDAMQ